MIRTSKPTILSLAAAALLALVGPTRAAAPAAPSPDTSIIVKNQPGVKSAPAAAASAAKPPATPAAAPAAPAAASAAKAPAAPAPAAAAKASAAPAAAPTANPAAASTISPACQELKSRIDAKIRAKGVTAFTLDVVSPEDVKDAKVVGTCENGKMKVTYRRG